MYEYYDVSINMRTQKWKGFLEQRIYEKDLWILKIITSRSNSTKIHFIGDSFYRLRSCWNFSIKQILLNRGYCRFGFHKTRLCRNTRGTNSIGSIVKGERPNSPIDEGWWLRRLQHDAGQIDVAPAFDVELRIAVDLCLRDCAWGQNKVKVVFGHSVGSARVKLGPRSMITISLKPPQSCN